MTRHVRSRVEVCVFDHAGGAQLPAGSMEPEEDPITAAVREAWEETGLSGLEVVRHVDAFEDDANRGRMRHVLHLRTTKPAPDEWWVLTPDGGGSQWRCRWVPIDGREGLHPFQERWLRAAGGAFDAGPELDVASVPSGAVEVFDAHNGVWVRMTTREGRRPDDGSRIGSCYGICVTEDRQVVLVRDRGGHTWDVPGGHHEDGESIEETFAREVAEEACARVLESELLMTSEDELLDGDRTVTDRWSTPLFWARVALDDWTAAFEKEARHLLPLDSLADALRWEIPPLLRLHELALAAEARR